MNKEFKYGFFPVDDGGNIVRSNEAPTAASGEPIVDAARALRARREGRIALLAGEPSPKAKAIIDKALGESPDDSPPAA